MNRWQSIPKGILMTGIGSLPHHNIDTAISYAFKFNIPFLPQIPVRHPKEYMLTQALDGMPGLKASNKGEVSININEWIKEESKLGAALSQAFGELSQSGSAFSKFEPTNDCYSAWQPFNWELEERHTPLAKIQLAGPLTSQWALKLSEPSTAQNFSEIRMQVFRLVLARSISMVRKLKSIGTSPLFYLDEPGLYAINKDNPHHTADLIELKLFIQALKKEGAIVGLHCCSNTDWRKVLRLDLDVISIDVQLSLLQLLKEKAELKQFLSEGGRLSLGIVPTSIDKEVLESFEPVLVFEKLLNDLFDNGIGNHNEVKALLSNSIYTSACGLALHKIEDAEIVLGYQTEFCELVSQYTEKQ